MKLSGRVKSVSVKNNRWSAMIQGKWVSQFLNEKTTPELKESLDAVRDGDTWEFEIVETASKDGKTKYLNVVGAAKTEDVGQDAGVQPDGHGADQDKDARISRSAAAHDAAAVVAAMIRAGQEATAEDLIVIARRIAKFNMTGE